MRINVEHIESFLLGGKCECVITNTKTKNRFRYIITGKKDSKVYFVKVFQDGDYVYAGHLTKDKGKGVYAFVQGKNGCVSMDALPVVALVYVLNNAIKLPNNVEVLHVGLCSRCGRKLTNPSSLYTGLGPECLKKTRVKIS